MTDNEYILSWQKADKELFETVTNYRMMFNELLGRYKRQKAEIERLQKELEIKTQKRVNMYETLDAFARGESKGRKNFAERLRKECVLISNSIDRATMLITIDALLEEMEGEGK